ncbi:hypothetical protein Pcinc_036646 [Petrolisthes cinctipes]|uniref:Uncharacterized protein n=1 Tax=Petrolisthes cinctipes TaxID=88211 RepID=A0AAE1EPF7_PETCI|nr:hypothetical protein Pcinc_036646 [Petrolisthes cinctipes]
METDDAGMRCQVMPSLPWHSNNTMALTLPWHSNPLVLKQHPGTHTFWHSNNSLGTQTTPLALKKTPWHSNTLALKQYPGTQTKPWHSHPLALKHPGTHTP